MYVWNNEGKYEHLGANIQKSIKVDKETFDIIQSCGGRSFSARVRTMAAEYKRMKTDSGIR